MFKLFAIILISAFCMSPSTAQYYAGARALASQIQNLNPNVIDFYGHQIGVPLLAPNVGLGTSLLSASMKPRIYVGESTPVLTNNGCYGGQFIGESRIGILAM